MKESMKDANFPTDCEGRTYHVNTKTGEVANRIITCGDPARARRIATFLDNPEHVFSHHSGRHFLTITGTYKSVPVSLVSIGMGMPNVDFFVRECRAVVHGPMVICRLGSCGAIDKLTHVGQVVVPGAAIAVTRNYNYFSANRELGRGRDGEKPYNMTFPESADKELAALLVAEMSKQVGAENVVTGVNVTADSFYCSQGRTSEAFRDDNRDLIEAIHDRYPEAVSMEMENHTLFHLANAARPMPGFGQSVRSIRAGACMIVFADRTRNEFINAERVRELEYASGVAVLEAITKCDLNVDESQLHPNEGSVWERKITGTIGSGLACNMTVIPSTPFRGPLNTCIPLEFLVSQLF